jgi:hypothetical protein
VRVHSSAERADALTCQVPAVGRDDIKHSFGRPPSTASAFRLAEGIASKGRPAGRSGHRFQVRLQLYGPHPVPRVNGGARGFVGDDDAQLDDVALDVDARPCHLETELRGRPVPSSRWIRRSSAYVRSYWTTQSGPPHRSRIWAV